MDAPDQPARQAPAPHPQDAELLRRAELALTQLHHAHGLDDEQAATLTAVRLRLEGRSRASLEELFGHAEDVDESDDRLLKAMRERRRSAPDLRDLMSRPDGRGRPSLDDYL